MKKFLLVAFVVAGVAFSVNAQKGTTYVYGNFGFNTKKDGGAAFGVNPGIGFGLNDNWSAGVNLGVNTASKDAIGGEEGITSFNVGPFVRYAKSLSNIFTVYGQLQAGYQANEVDVYGLSGKKGNGIGVQFFPAIYLDVKNGFGLNFNFGGINYSSFNPKGNEKASPSFDINFGQGFGFGISKTFGGGKK